MATEIDVPKYRENQKGMKAPSSWQYSSQYLSQPMLGVCVCVCVKVLCSVRHQRLWLARSPSLRDTYSCCVRACVSICVYNPQNVCVHEWFLNVWRRVCVLFLLYISLFPAHFFFFCVRKPGFYASTRRFLVMAGVSPFVCVRARVRALQQHAILMSNGSCSLFILQPVFLYMASARHKRARPLTPSHTSHTAEYTRHERKNVFHSSATAF